MRRWWSNIFWSPARSLMRIRAAASRAMLWARFSDRPIISWRRAPLYLWVTMAAMASPVRMTMAEMVARSLLLRLFSRMGWLPQPGQALLHGPDGLVPVILKGNKTVDQEPGQNFLAFRVLMHGQEGPLQPLPFCRRQVPGGHQGWNAVRGGFFDDPGSRGEDRVGSLKIFPYQPIHRRPVHQAPGHRQDGIVMAVCVNDFTEKGLGALLQFHQPERGHELPGVGFRVGEGKGMAFEIRELVEGAVF